MGWKICRSSIEKLLFPCSACLSAQFLKPREIIVENFNLPDSGKRFREKCRNIWICYLRPFCSRINDQIWKYIDHDAEYNNDRIQYKGIFYRNSKQKSGYNDYSEELHARFRKIKEHFSYRLRCFSADIHEFSVLLMVKVTILIKEYLLKNPVLEISVEAQMVPEWGALRYDPENPTEGKIITEAINWINSGQ